MGTLITDMQRKGIQKISALKDDFAYGNLSWISSMHITVANDQVCYSNVIDTLINTFCAYELADNDYMNIHLEANQYSNKPELFLHTTVEKLLKHLTYIIWTDKLVDGYLPARIKDQTIYRILHRLSQLEPLILTSAA